MKTINEEFVKGLKPPERGQHIVWDDTIPGFGVRITSGGAIAFVLNYTMNGKRRRYKIGRYPVWNATIARKRAKELSVGVDKAIDPVEQELEQKRQSQSEPTFAELAHRYLGEHAKTYKSPSSLCQDRNHINRLLPLWATLQVKSITRRDVEKVHSDFKATPYYANRIRSLLSKMFNLAVQWGWRTDNPVKGVIKFHEDKRERWLTTEEVDRLERALDAYEDQNAADAIRLLLRTGSRAGEVMKADWTQFDMDRRTWTKPSHHTKQKKIEHVPLNPEALAVLRKMKPKQSGPLFPSKNGDARVTLRRPWLQILKAAGLAEAVQRKGKRRMITRYKPTVRLHDLRHTFASYLVSQGESLYNVGKLMGHTNPAITDRYAHAYDESLRETTNRLGSMFKNKKRKR
jgi:integrase